MRLFSLAASSTIAGRILATDIFTRHTAALSGIASLALRRVLSIGSHYSLCIIKLNFEGDGFFIFPFHLIFTSYTFLFTSRDLFDAVLNQIFGSFT